MTSDSFHGARFRPGQRLDRFQVVREVGRGGQGVVLEAQDLSQGGLRVALKLLHAADEQTLRRARREAQVLAQLDHPGLPRVHGAGELSSGIPYLALEWIEGRTLEANVKQLGPLAPLAAAELIAQAAETLAYCHERGVLHRDIKPANLMLEPHSSRVVLVDFGLLRPERHRFALDDPASLTRSGVLLGTPAYMAPEQVSGAPVTTASDLYSLGATFFFALTGQQPFVYPTVVNLLRAVLEDPVPDPRSLRPARLPPPSARLAELCGQLLAKHPAERPHSAADLAVALRAATAELDELGGRRVPGLFLSAGLILAGGLILALAVVVVGPARSAPAPADPPGPPPTSGPLPGNDPAALLLAEGYDHLSTKRAHDAVEVFSVALALESAHATLRQSTLVGRGQAYMLLSQLEDALRDFDQALLLGPSPLAAERGGDAYMRLGRPAAAARSFNQALDQGARSAPLYARFAETLAQIGRWRQAGDRHLPTGDRRRPPPP